MGLSASAKRNGWEEQRMSSQGTQSALGSDRDGMSEQIAAAYNELRRLASSYLRRERGDHTLQTTALVHEAYLRLCHQRQVRWDNREQFLGVAAQLMRRILVDYSRARHAAKRGGDVTRVALHEGVEGACGRAADVVALDAALDKLAELDPPAARLVELRFFAGLTVEEAASVLGVSPATVKRNWSVAKAWLARELRAPGTSK